MMQNLQIETIFETLTMQQVETVATVLAFQMSQPIHALSNALELAAEEPAEAAELLPVASKQVDRLAGILEQLRQRARGAELVG